MIKAVLIFAILCFSTLVESCTWTIDGKCFTLVNTTMSVIEAQIHCKTTYGGNLATISNLHEDDHIRIGLVDCFLSDIISGKMGINVWMGAIKYGGYWRWISGDEWTYDNFAHGQPNNDGIGCNYCWNPSFDWSETWTWCDAPIEDPHVFICQS